MGSFGHLTAKDTEFLASASVICDFGRAINWSWWNFSDKRVRSRMLPCLSRNQ